jgi:translation initiation factor IF-1
VIARWGEETALLRLDDGKSVEAPVPDALRGRFEVGDPVTVELAGGRVVAWDLASA